jgi:hypothetical protein
MTAENQHNRALYGKSSLFEVILFPSDLNKDWHMQPCERVALFHVLNMTKPVTSIEIGTFLGGSLRPISAYSLHVYTFDINSDHHRIRPQFSNVSFITGDTAQTLPEVIATLNRASTEINFVLVDGSHEEQGVYSDLCACLEIVPINRPCVILMHDSFNPAVRAAILKTPWSSNPYVQGVDLDFVPGALYNRPDRWTTLGRLSFGRSPSYASRGGYQCTHLFIV